MNIIPTILCGGAGSRLWPLSRELHPKPFIRLQDGQSLLQKAFMRGALLPGVQDILSVTKRDLFFKIHEEFAELNQQKLRAHYILEPVGRNTAAAIAMSALYLKQLYGGEALMLVLAADHLISDQQSFEEAVKTAAQLAMQDKLVTFGISPDQAHTGYGYIETSGHDVLRFVEKPSLEEAEGYLATGRFLWNSGMFLFKTETILAAFESLCPDLLKQVQRCFDQSKTQSFEGGQQLQLDEASFALVEENSIDYAVMEPAKNVAVVACDIGWSDVGSWNVLGDLTQADAQGNRISGQACLHEVSNCTISSDSRMVGAVGVDNLLIIDTPDALLVADQSRAQDVKHLYSQLKAQDHEAHKLHRTVHRPWGNYTVLEEGSSFKIKRIVVKPQASLSLQMHHHRSEHWIVVSGMAEVVCGEQTFLISTNQSTYIPAGFKHRLKNPGILELVMIEVQSGLYLGEDDIVRFEDIYGRVETPA